MKLIIATAIVIAITTTNAYANKDMAITFCNSEIKDNFHSSVKIQFPAPIVTENDAFYFVHYKEAHKLITGNGNTQVDARCTIHKSSYTITYINIAGKDKTKPYDRSAL